MIQSAAGIILRTRPLTETSLIVHWLTPDFGQIATVARGARRPKSPFFGKLDLFYEADFSFNRSRRGDLHILREAALRNPNSFLRNDISKLRQAAYAAALVVQTTETETPLAGIFELFKAFLQSLEAHPPLPQVILTFELRILAELGLQPDWTKTSLTAGSRKIVEALLQRDWTSIFGVKLAHAQIGELRQFLHGFLVFHLGKVPRGRTQALLSHD